MVFVADDLAAWLIGALADAGRKKLTTIVVGTDQERALRSAATAAVQRAAGELRPDDAERAETLTRLVNRAFIKALVPGAPMAGYGTLLEALQAGIAGRLAVVDDTGPAGAGQAPLREGQRRPERPGDLLRPAGIYGVAAIPVLGSDALEDEMPSFWLTVQQKEALPSAIPLLPLNREFSRRHQFDASRRRSACQARFQIPPSRPFFEHPEHQ